MQLFARLLRAFYSGATGPEPRFDPLGEQFINEQYPGVSHPASSGLDLEEICDRKMKLKTRQTRASAERRR